jgi:hypothetical protein
MRSQPLFWGVCFLNFHPPSCSNSHYGLKRIKNWLKPGLRGFGVPALAGGAVAQSSALKFFEVIVFASAAPPEGGTPNLHPLLKLGLLQRK